MNIYSQERGIDRTLFKGSIIEWARNVFRNDISHRDILFAKHWSSSLKCYCRLLLRKLFLDFWNIQAAEKVSQLTQQICCSSKSSPGRSQWHEWLLLHCTTNYLAFQRYIVNSGKGRICQDKWPFSRTLSRFLWHEVTGGFATPPGWDVCP